ncbi:DUF3006 domain-containing protein [Thermacetogenium phaeum]|jgi:hypothetical protein|uniref:DUF3006 domain-containing protein n=1 Tax=Thermacetogenium phaeum TaxID=85874 RepID=UPI0009D9ED9B|nr:DUF3006 domain-containing protein [Thermacetogenium phaeum]
MTRVIIRGVVDRIEGEQVVVLLGDEGVVLHLPRQFIPEVRESDLLSLDIRVEVPAEEVRKMSPKSLLERLAWRPDR